MHDDGIVAFEVGAFVDGQVVAQLDALTTHTIGMHLQLITEQLTQVAQVALTNAAQATEQNLHDVFLSLRAVPRSQSADSAAMLASQRGSSPASPRATCRTKSPR